MKNRNFELCLCERCVAGFYQSKEYWVTREDPYQVIKDECAFCQIRRGYDYLSLAKGGLYHTHRQGCVANVTDTMNRY